MKQKMLVIIKNLLPVLLFNVIFFVAWGTINPLSVWVSYFLIHLSYFMLILTPLFNSKSKRNRFFGFTNKMISVIYFFIQFAVGLIFIILELETVNICLYIQLPILAIYFVILLSNIIFNDKTEKRTCERQYDIDFIRNCILKLELLLQEEQGEVVFGKLMKLKESFETSPSKSYPEVSKYEKEIVLLVEEIGETTDEERASLLNEVEKKLLARNKTIKTLQ